MNVRAEFSTIADPLTDHELKDIMKTHQPHDDDHLKQIRQRIDQISLQHGAINETGSEAGLAEAEATA